MVGGGQPPEDGRQLGGAGAALGGGQRLVAGQHRAERIRAPRLVEKPLRGADDLERVCLALRAARAPGRDPVPAEYHADRRRAGPLELGDIEAELEPRPPPRQPADPVAETRAGERLAVGGGGERDAGIGVQVVDVRQVEQPVHRGVDGRRGAAPMAGRHPAQAMQAVVERRHHLILAPGARVDAGQRAEPVQPQYREAGRGQGAEIAAGPLDPEQLHWLAGDRVGRLALRRGVAAGVVGVARIGAEPVAALQQRGDLGRFLRRHACLLAGLVTLWIRL